MKMQLCAGVVVVNTCLGLYLDCTGFAEARMHVRAFSVAIIPALAMETVCCSMASWSMARVVSDI
jgi:hypothetical protein